MKIISSKSDRGFRGRVGAIGAAIAFVLGASASCVQATELPEQWLEDFAEAKAKARKEDKPILAVFSASWCPPCRYMEQHVYPQKEVVEALKEWVPVYIDSDRFQRLAMVHRITVLPTYVVFDCQAAELGRFTGGVNDAADFLKRIHVARVFKTRVAELRAELKDRPDGVALLKELGALLTAQGGEEEYGEGIEAYKKALRLAPEDTGDIPETLLEEVRGQLDFERELASLSVQLDASPKDPRLLKQRGDLYTGLASRSHADRFEKGLADYRAAAQLDPEDTTGAGIALGFFELVQQVEDGQPDCSGKLKEFEAKYPQSAYVSEAMFLRALLSLERGQRNRCIEILQELIERSPEDEFARYARQIVAELKPDPVE